jgi:6-pyruvoyltetrahydropterin/6-carboxytetrahydropterin synthase
MPRMYVTRRERFCASHCLASERMSPDQNRELFGACAGLHGHNYEMEVTVAGEVRQETGYVFDLKILKDLIRSELIQKIDHRHLNTDVEFLRNVNPTVETLVRAFWNILEPKIPSGMLYSIRLRETENNVVEYRGEA